MNPNGIRGAPPLLGPMRVLPGRLSVSRTFGDCLAKIEKHGGNPKCIVAEPDVFTVAIDEELDFILIGSDGIFDRVSTEDTVQAVIDEARLKTEAMKVSTRHHGQCSFEHVAQVVGDAVDKVMLLAMELESMDNLSVVIISFKNFTKFLESIEP